MECLISLDRIVPLGQIGPLARVGSTKIRTAPGCALAGRYARPMQIVIPALCPPRNSPFDKGSRNRRGSPPLRSPPDPRRAAMGPKSLTRSLAGYYSPASIQLTPKAFLHLVSLRSDRPSPPCRLCPGTAGRGRIHPMGLRNGSIPSASTRATADSDVGIALRNRDAISSPKNSVGEFTRRMTPICVGSQCMCQNLTDDDASRTVCRSALWIVIRGP